VRTLRLRPLPRRARQNQHPTDSTGMQLVGEIHSRGSTKALRLAWPRSGVGRRRQLLARHRLRAGAGGRADNAAALRRPVFGVLTLRLTERPPAQTRRAPYSTLGGRSVEKRGCANLANGQVSGCAAWLDLEWVKLLGRRDRRGRHEGHRRQGRREARPGDGRRTLQLTPSGSVENRWGTGARAATVGPTATPPEEVRPMNAVRTWVLPSSRSGG
jgi:hypothetical protein